MKYQTITAKSPTSDHLYFKQLCSEGGDSINTSQQIGNTEVTCQRKPLPIFLAVTAAVVFVSAPLVTWADVDGDEIPYSEAKLFIELNHTDGDLGIHALIDGDAWKTLKIEDPKGREMLDIRVNSRLKRQGLTEIFFESAEPPFSELDPEDFFLRFPEGQYEIEGKTLEGEELESEVLLTHVMPAPAIVTVNDQPMAVQCNEDAPFFDATEVIPPVVIAWEPVSLSHPDPVGGGAGVQQQVPVTIHNYEVVLEVEVDDFTSTIHVILPPSETAMMVPAEFISLGEEFKYEVLAREVSFNQTAVESCFVLE